VITWTVRLRSKPDTIDRWIAIARELTETSNRMDPGCVVYICLQHLDDPQEFTWYEQWADMPTLRAHVDRINPLLGGPPRPGEWTAPRLFEVLESREQLTWHEFQERDPHLRNWFAPGLSQLVYTTVKPGHAAAYAALARDLTRAAQAAGGCETWILHQDADNPDRFMLFEQWRDAAAREAWMASPAAAGARDHVASEEVVGVRCVA
jgi:quinol monooxygenase YgiN